jgi:sterol 14-demethylase
MATCRELAEDKQAIQDLRKHFFDMEQSSTPVSVLFPWFPSPAKKLKTKATRELYFLIKKYVAMRREVKVPSSDPIDFLIANGDSDQVIVNVSTLNLFYSCGGPFDVLVCRPSWELFSLEL